MKKHIKALFLGVVPVFTFTLLVSCVEAAPSEEVAIIEKHVETKVEPKTIVEENSVFNKDAEGVEITSEAVEKSIVDKKEELETSKEVEVVKQEPLVEVKEVIEETIIETVEEVVVELEEVGVNHSIWNSLLKKNVSTTGKVNYKGFKADKAKLQQYLTLLKSKSPSNDWSKNEKLAYWINVYNAFTVKLIVDNYPLKSITNLDKPWDKKFISIQGKTYSLGDVENNILRKMGESRIHFAINCASVSCPKLLNEAFTAEKLSSQLRSVTKSFFSDKTKNQLTDGGVKISKLFEWYAVDFSKGNIIAYINKYSGQTVGASSKISYLEYNWNLNE